MAGRLGLKGPAHGLDLPQHLDAQLELRSAGGRSLEVTKWSEKQVKTPLSQTLHGTAINAYIDPPNHHPDVGIYIYMAVPLVVSGYCICSSDNERSSEHWGASWGLFSCTTRCRTEQESFPDGLVMVVFCMEGKNTSTCHG